MKVYVARDNGAGSWIGVFPTLAAAQAAAETWVQEYGVRVNGLPHRITRRQIQGWERTGSLVPLNVYKLRVIDHVIDLQTNVEVAEFNFEQ